CKGTPAGGAAMEPGTGPAPGQRRKKQEHPGCQDCNFTASAFHPVGMALPLPGALPKPSFKQP
ncbi:MAG: hypothetical protein WBF88_13165, partial [Pusillimonas sp.]